MPVLHKYKDKPNGYILTSIENKIITFQLTEDGYNKLLEVGIQFGHPFQRAILLDLYRLGFAYTKGTGTGEPIPEKDDRQLELDLSNDPEPETLFPRCAHCSSIDDLCLVTHREEKPSAIILCSECRPKIDKIDTSTPLALLTLPTINRLLKTRQIETVDKSIEQYQNLLRTKLANRWEQLSKKGIQGQLFDGAELGEDKLI